MSRRIASQAGLSEGLEDSVSTTGISSQSQLPSIADARVYDQAVAFQHDLSVSEPIADASCTIPLDQRPAVLLADVRGNKGLRQRMWGGT